jgi:ParB family chromosome partitioning protein
LVDKFKKILHNITLKQKNKKLEEKIMSNDELKLVPLESIEVVPGFNPRLSFDNDKMDELERSISINGLFMPLWVQANGVNKYKLVDGERRFRCIKNINEKEEKKAKELGEKYVPIFERVQVVVLPAAMSDIDLLTHTFTFGSKGENLNPLEIGGLIYKLKTNFRMQLNDIAAKLSMHQSRVSDLLSVYCKADAETIAGLKANTIKVTNVIKYMREGKNPEGKVIDEDKAKKKEEEKRFMSIIPQWIDWLWGLAMKNLPNEEKERYEKEQWPVGSFLRGKYEKYLPKSKKVNVEDKVEEKEYEEPVEEKKRGRGRPKKIKHVETEEDNVIDDEEIVTDESDDEFKDLKEEEFDDIPDTESEMEDGEEKISLDDIEI